MIFPDVLWKMVKREKQKGEPGGSPFHGMFTDAAALNSLSHNQYETGLNFLGLQDFRGLTLSGGATLVVALDGCSHTPRIPKEPIFCLPF